MDKREIVDLLTMIGQKSNWAALLGALGDMPIDEWIRLNSAFDYSQTGEPEDATVE